VSVIQDFDSGHVNLISSEIDDSFRFLLDSSTVLFPSRLLLLALFAFFDKVLLDLGEVFFQASCTFSTLIVHLVDEGLDKICELLRNFWSIF